ncbi:hypothetical protein [Limosilactobacillus ingluviei]|uniref:hypothetical protein n=1 Tax=Limosilactobacillus ingluviei TaxID=148604 RepID=UPI00265FDFA8|nr:hypothetical protein [Limosilactobacillus ingluviei]
MGSLSYEEKLTIQLMRNKNLGLKPGNISDIAKRFGISKVYAYTVIHGNQHGPASDEWRRKFAAYAGLKD